MNDVMRQREIHAKCFHSSGAWAESSIEGFMQPIPRRFEQIAAQYPNNIALKLDDRSIAYSELNVLANRLAHRLIAASPDPAQPVILLLEHGASALIGMLGVLKAGRSFVTLDRSYPRARLERIIEDAGNGVIVSNQKNLALANEFAAIAHAIVDMDADCQNVPQTNPDIHIALDSMAYLIYTSGSTGEPKGIASPHRMLMANILTYTELLHICPEDVIANLHNCAFASSFTEMYCALLNGATVRPWDFSANGYTGLQEMLERDGVTIMNWGATPFRHFTKLLTEEGLPTLRILMLGNEPVLHGDVELYKKYCNDDAIFVHRFGTSESGNVTLLLIDKQTVIEDSVVPAGYAVPGQEILILDENGNSVEAGQTGAIAVRNQNRMAIGYWRKPELTEEKFSFSTETGLRTFFLGDIGILHADGRLVVLGRQDFQVKIRGHRIEIGEIENVLSECPGIQDAAVIAETDGSGEPRLIAYIVEDSEHPQPLGAIRGRLSQYLPRNMTPAAFRYIQKMPVTSTGKLDRSALPRQETVSPILPDIGGVSPQTPLELFLHAQWRETLSASGFGTHDNFFALGGDSIKAALISNRIQREFGEAISLAVMFERPTIAQLALYLAERVRNDDSRDEFDLTTADATRRRPEQIFKRQAPLIAVNASDAPAALSFAQERFWIIQRLEPESAAYNLCAAWTLKGDLDEGALKRSLMEITRRHAVLRACYIWEFDKAVQITRPVEEFRIASLNLAELSKDAGRTRLQALIKAEIQRPYRLSVEFPMRLHIVRLGATEHALIVGCHHIVWDAWSKNLFQHELSNLYKAFSSGNQPHLPPPPIQYSDYASWQRARFSEAALSEQIAYWKARMADAPSLALPYDSPASATQENRGASHYFELPRELTEALKEFSQRQAATLFMTCLAAFHILLHRHSGQTDVTVGMPVASRSQEETEQLIGCFLNILPIRAAIAPERSFAQTLADIKTRVLEALANQEAPFEKLVEILKAVRGRERTPLVQALFQFHNTPQIPLTLDGIDVSSLQIESEAAHYDITITMRENDGTLLGRVDYNCELFRPETIVRMAQRYAALLQAAVQNPETTAGTLPILPEAEREQILNGWNQTEVQRAEEEYIALFERQVAQTPDAKAVVFESESLTYRELNARANRLARTLQENGVAPDVPVGLYLERSLDFLTGFLGVLKAGGACTPLNPTYPLERLQYILEDASVAVVITRSRLHAPLSCPNAKTLCLEREAPRIAQQSVENIGCRAQPNHLAYILYTSGSTGSPKGVMVARRGMQNHILSTVEDFGLNSEDRVAQTASMSFDIAVWQLLAALICGGTTYIVPHDVAADPVQLAIYCAENRITTLEIVPSYLSVALDADLPCDSDRKTFSTLRRLIATGEALSPALCRRWFALCDAPLVNGYGPTECSDRVSRYQFHAPPDAALVHLPIGRPIANTQLYILDASLQPVPIGVSGELYIGGAGVGRGYLNRPEETRKRFVPNPFGSGNLFKTGDVARYLSDGNLEFLGRNDRQIKLRGFRVELGEIEAVIEERSEVFRSVAIADSRDGANARVIAYIVFQRGEYADATDIETWLRNKLPDYMVPSAIVILDEFPVTARGKLDYAALPIPEISLQPRVSEAPRDDLELQLAQLWERVLGVNNLGIHDNFFELGGHSLLAVRLFDQIFKATGKRLPVSALFQRPTVARLAELLRLESRPQSWKSLARIQTGGSRPPLYLAPPLASTALKIEGVTRHLPKHQPVYAIEYLGLGDDLDPHESIEEMGKYYADQIIALQPDGPYLVGGFCFGCMVALEIAQELRRRGREVALCALVGADRPHHGPSWSPPKRFSREHWATLNEFWKELGFKVWARRYVRNKIAKRFAPPEKQAQLFPKTFQAHFSARLKHRVLPYSGRLFLIQTEDFERRYISRRWDEIGTGTYERVIVPEISHNEALYTEPYSKQIAAILSAKIEDCLGGKS